jgi:peptidoglycan L-alanyl-D-glutamate endopeptidase CwlK
MRHQRCAAARELRAGTEFPAIGIGDNLATVNCSATLPEGAATSITTAKEASMSAPILKTDILFAQRLLSAAGLYGGKLDGLFNDALDQAESAFDKIGNDIATALGRFDMRSEGAIATLLPKAQELARKFMKTAVTSPFQVKILSGTRNYTEQNALFAKRPKVTNARGGQSNHNFGIAWDVGIFVDGKYLTGKNAKEDKAYADLAAQIKGALQGIEWGGDWKTFKDAPHYQLASGKSVAQIRALFEKGKAYI